MSLVVLTFKRDATTGEAETFWPEAASDSLAGFESWRTEIWGAEALRRRGATIFPELRDRDLFVEKEELDEFEAECRMLLPDTADILRESGGNPEPRDYPGTLDAVAWRMRNILKAIDRARQIEGGVYIG